MEAIKYHLTSGSIINLARQALKGAQMESGRFSNPIKSEKLRNYSVIARLDDAIPLNTEEWIAVERFLNQVSEFVPIPLLNSLTETIVAYADDQARRGYLLGQEDIVKEMKNKASRIA